MNFSCTIKDFYAIDAIIIFDIHSKPIIKAIPKNVILFDAVLLSALGYSKFYQIFLC